MSSIQKTSYYVNSRSSRLVQQGGAAVSARPYTFGCWFATVSGARATLEYALLDTAPRLSVPLPPSRHANQSTLVARSRIVYAENAFAELVLWKVPSSVAGSSHSFKYRLAYVVDSVCVVRYDNETGRGDHRHFGDQESPYSFTTPEALLMAFERDIERWNRENSDS
jgi:hypothetical protein